MQFGLDVAQHQLSWDVLLERVRFAERMGFNGIWLFDHFKPLYGDPSGPCLEAWTLLAALAVVTTRIRLGTLVTGITYRHPSMLTAEAITVDHLSGGRLELAVGAAWHEEEHRELGFDFPPASERVQRLGEAVQVMRALMTRDGVTFSGKYYRLEDASYHPRPVQHPHPPLWIGAGGPKMLEVVGREADAWHGGGSLDDLKRKSALLDGYARAAGRDPSAIRRSTSISVEGPMEDVLRQAISLRDAGFSYLVVGWPSAGQVRIQEFLEKVFPEVAA